MTAVFPTFFREQLFADLTLLDPASVYWVYFTSHAAFTGPDDPRYAGIETVDDLQDIPGWSLPMVQSAAQNVGTITIGNTSYVVANNPFVMDPSWEESQVSAAALVINGTVDGVADPVVMLTDSPFSSYTTMRPQDSLTAAPDSVAGSNRWIVGWPVPPSGSPVVLPTEGPLVIFRAPPDYELSHQQHAWLFPQRVNLIANPSFEGGVEFWRTDGSIARSNVGAPGGGVWRADVTGGVIESNMFPLDIAPAVEDMWTIQVMIGGTGRCRIGLVAWEEDFAATSCDWGPDTDVWDLPADGYLHIYALRRSGEATTGMVRIECDGGDMHIDNVLCEPDWLAGWPYFDGDTTYGTQGDFSWYGGENRKGQTYSLWYNHRRAVVGRLFAWSIADDDFVVTDEEVESQGYVYKWVPAGVRVVPHLDVLRINDIRQVLDPVSGSVLDVKVDDDDALGVSDAWDF